MSKTIALPSTTLDTKTSAFATALERPDVQREMALILADHPNVGRLVAGITAISLVMLNNSSPEAIENESAEWEEEPAYPSAKVSSSLRPDAEAEALAAGESGALGLVAACLSRFLLSEMPNGQC